MSSATTTAAPTSAWPALWALVLGFFMILVDATIVQVATPALMQDLGSGVNGIVWVTSAYLLAYAVPLLVTGRLGDRFGPRRVYLAGLAVFTLASLWCGFTATVEHLVVARVFQGLGASLMTPQTMAVITRTFPADQRGRAMSLWGAVAGVATLVGPVLGGLLVDSLGWEWIFFINVPVGVVGFVLALRLVPALPTHVHRFDLLGVLLSAAGVGLLVFGIQEGWPPLIVGGVAVLAVFVLWQARNRSEPLVPLTLFRHRNFGLANIAIATVGLSVTAFNFPLMLYAQEVRGFGPTGAALLLAPSAVLSGVLAPVVGRLTDRADPRVVAGTGMVLMPVSLIWLAAVLRPDVPVWALLLPIVLNGIANPFLWAPIGSTATRDLPASRAGAGSGVYNTTRQIGAVLGSSGIAALMQSRLTALAPDAADRPERAAGVLPVELHAGYSAAMAQSLLFPAAVLLIGLVAVLCLTPPRRRTAGPPPQLVVDD